MNKREMAEALRNAHLSINVDGHPLSLGELAAATLEREAEAEEKAKPKVTLEEQIDGLRQTCRSPHCECDNSLCPAVAAADTLRRLRDEGGRLLAASEGECCASRSFLRSLGVEPKP